MDIERVQPPQGLRVERTGSEQQRRRKQEMQEAFDELLESSLSEDETEEQPSKEQDQAQQGPDTVSITNGLPTPTLVNDYVSIANIAKLGKQPGPAKESDGNTAIAPSEPQASGPGLTESDQDGNDVPAAPSPEAEEEEQPPVSIDTLA